MGSISIVLADVSVRISNKRILYSWIQNIIQSEKFLVGNLTLVLCSDNYLLDLNKKFLSHDYYTDIITFDYSEGKIVSGELYISTERVMDNAGKYNTEFYNELYRVMAHGILHLCGYGDKSDIEKKRMRSKENQKLKLLKV